jgi:capsule polysaccharide export protein KpsE/RkpR
MIGGRNNGALFLSLLHSGTVTGHLIDRFQLQHVYRKRYVEDTAKKLDRKTAISEDAKSGVITITVEDTDRARARDMAQAYVDELNALVAQVDTSSAHREREFVEQRLKTASFDLQQAEIDMSRFSAKNAAIDIKEQTRAMVDADARLQGQLVASKSELDSLQQIYGSQNVRVRSAEARVGTLQRELTRQSEGAAVPPAGSSAADAAQPYPALRQLPGLAVPWENLYRRVRIAETVYEMLSADHESARIEEARSIPTLRVIDPPGLAERKSSPHRLVIIATSTALALMATSLLLLFRRSWLALAEDDSRRALASNVAGSLAKYRPSRRGAPR